MNFRFGNKPSHFPIIVFEKHNMPIGRITITILRIIETFNLWFDFGYRQNYNRISIVTTKHIIFVLALCYVSNSFVGIPIFLATTLFVDFRRSKYIAVLFISRNICISTLFNQFTTYIFNNPADATWQEGLFSRRSI